MPDLQAPPPQNSVTDLLDPKPLLNFLWQHKGLLNPMPLVQGIGNIGRYGGAALADQIAGQDTTPLQYIPKTDQEKQDEAARLKYNADRGVTMYAEGLAKGSDMDFWQQSLKTQAMIDEDNRRLGALMNPQPPYHTGTK